MRGVFINAAAFVIAVFSIIDRHSGNNVSADVEMVGSAVLIALGFVYDAVTERR